MLGTSHHLDSSTRPSVNVPAGKNVGNRLPVWIPKAFPDDAELVALARGGDPEALAEIELRMETVANLACRVAEADLSDPIPDQSRTATATDPLRPSAGNPYTGSYRRPVRFSTRPLRVRRAPTSQEP